MSRFLSERHAALSAYTPGEQPRDRRYIKLNTNESPFPPSAGVAAAVAEQIGCLQLYSDPASTALTEAIADHLGVSADEVLVTNGSDEILEYAFAAFGDATHPIAFPDVTYGFYPVFAALWGVPTRIVPLREDFSLNVHDYDTHDGPVVIANPNAPTGLALPLSDIEQLLLCRPDRVVIVDEAYVDFGTESAVSLVKRYPNLLVTRTFSKSFSMAGARLGFGVACAALIADLALMKNSKNPYNVNRMTAAAGLCALKEADYYYANARTIANTRERTMRALCALGFEGTDSRANFLFVHHPRLSGEELYAALRERGILVRHLTGARTSNYIRITVGTEDEMQATVAALSDIVKETL